jgi:hypothetical protein
MQAFNKQVEKSALYIVKPFFSLLTPWEHRTKTKNLRPTSSRRHYVAPSKLGQFQLLPLHPKYGAIMLLLYHASNNNLAKDYSENWNKLE